MKYDFDIRAIAFENQTIEDKHTIFLDKLAKLGRPWGLVDEPLKVPDCGSELVAMPNVSKVLNKVKGVGGWFMYHFRRPFDDSSSYDDKIMLSFNPAKIDYRSLIDDALLSYVAAFDAYYAEIADQEFLHIDFEESRKVNSRYHLYRLQPVSYLRRDYCDRALKLSPAQIVARLNGQVARVEEALGGVFIVLTYDPLSTDEMNNLCWEKKALLA
jgi:hypothetical protein